jgi:hypothetical protein
MRARVDAVLALVVPLWLRPSTFFVRASLTFCLFVSLTTAQALDSTRSYTQLVSVLRSRRAVRTVALDVLALALAAVALWVLVSRRRLRRWGIRMGRQSMMLARL